MSDKVISVIKYVLLGLSAIVPVLFLMDFVDLDVFLGLAYVLFGLAVALMVIFPVVNIIINPANAKKSLMGFLGLVAFFVLAFFMSSSEALPFSIPNPDNVPGVLRFVDTSVISLYLLSIIAVGSIVYTEVRDLFR